MGKKRLVDGALTSAIVLATFTGSCKGSCRGATNIDSTFWFGDATSNPSLVRGGLNSAESTRELSAESDQGITTGFTRVEPLVELSI